VPTRFTVLGSGSGGNASFLETDQTRLLIDAGLSCRQIRLRLAQMGRSPETLDGILLTHEHTDHTQGLKALCGKLAALPDDTLVYCGHEYTEGNLNFALTVEPENGEIKERHAKVRELRANAAADWHDATPAEMTIPSSIGEEKATNPFMRASSAEELGRIRTLKDSF